MTTASSSLKKAREYEARKDWEKALAEYRRILDSEGGKNPSLLNVIGDIYAKRMDIERAFQNYEKAIEIYCEETLYNNAIALCKKCLRVDAERLEIYHRLGGLYASQGLVHEAIQFLTEYGERKAKAGDAEAVDTTWRRMLEIAPNRPGLRSHYADVLIKMRRPHEAVDALAGLAELLHRLGALDEAKQVESRMQGIFERIASQEGTPIPEAVKPEESAAPSTAAAPAPEIDWTALDLRGTAKSAPAAPKQPTGPIPQKLSTLKNAAVPLDMRTGNVSVSDRAQQEDDLIDLDDVLSEFRSGVSEVITKGDFQSQYDLGMSYKEMELWDDAIEAFRAATSGDDLCVPALEMIAQCLLEKGEVVKAIEHLTQSITGTGSAEQGIGLQYLLGNAYLRVNDRDRARACYDAVVAVDPAFRDVQERLSHISEAT